MELKRNDFSDVTTEDLIKKKKSTSFVTGLLAGCIIAYSFIAIFQIINEGFTPILIIPFVSLPVLIIIYKQVKSMDQELKSRESN
jgi:fructose-specific phosphotransferase system IIC component